MLLGPVFRMEMVTVGRRARYIVARALFASALLVVLWIACTDTQVSGNQLGIQQSAEIASKFFTSFSWLMLMCVLVSTPALSVGTITLERERRTIEYLFASDLGNHEIVLGKLAVRILVIFWFMLVALPILAIFRLMGGIPGTAVVGIFAICGSTALSVMSVALCVSVWTARSRDAVVRVYVVLAALLGVPFVFGFMRMAGLVPVGWLVDNLVTPPVNLLLAMNPVWITAFDLRITPGGDVMAIDMSIVRDLVVRHLVASGLLIVLAVVAVRRVHLRSSSRSDSSEGKRGEIRVPRYRPPLGRWPMVWKELFSQNAMTKFGFVGRIALTVLVCTFVAVMVAVFVGAASGSLGTWRQPWEHYLQFASIIGSMYGCGLLIVMAARAASLVTLEIERECWTSLVSTPLTSNEILSAKVLGNFYTFRWLILVFVVIWGLEVLLNPFFAFVLPALVVELLVAGAFATNVGMLYSLNSTTSLRAMGWTIPTVFFAGGGYMFFCCVMGPTNDLIELALCGCIPFLLSVPAVLFGMFFGNVVSGRSEFVEFFAYYIAGTLGYTVVATVLYVVALSQFDRIARGRPITSGSAR